MDNEGKQAEQLKEFIRGMSKENNLYWCHSFESDGREVHEMEKN